MKQNQLRRGDGVIIAAFLISAAIGWALLRPSAVLERVSVWCDGREIASYTLTLEGDYVLNTPFGTNMLRIAQGVVRIIDADCPDRLCVYMGSQSEAGGQIVCLPHRLLVRLEGGIMGLDGLTY